MAQEIEPVFELLVEHVESREPYGIEALIVTVPVEVFLGQMVLGESYDEGAEG